MPEETKRNKSIEEIIRADLHKRQGTSDEILKEWATDPYPVNGEVATKFWNYVRDNKYIEIVGDYDVDGICASFIMTSAIKELYPDKKVKVRIPRRFSEGYGINSTIVEEIKTSLPKGSLVITVDNGIAAGPVLKELKDAGYVVLVTDHHSAREGVALPETDMLIDPAVASLDNPFIGNYWCGAGVAFKLAEPFLSKEKAEELSVYAGLATVADCMNLVEGNWGLVRHAIQLFREKKAPKPLCDLLVGMGQDPNFCNEDHFGFYLGPAFNAPGRLLDKGASEVLKYLWHPTEEGCARLVELNNERKRIRDEEFAILDKYLEDTGRTNACPIWAAFPGLHEGIVGILAGKVSEKYEKPALVLTDTHIPDVYKGSGRSYGKFNIFGFLSDMPKETFLKMGGHSGACGLSMTLDNIKIAEKVQVDSLKLQAEAGEDNLRYQIVKDKIPAIEKVLSDFRPFGQGNPAPEFEMAVDMQRDKPFMSPVKNEKGQKDPTLGAHLFITDKKKKYKVTHFRHTPNNLVDQNKFELVGHIIGSAFGGEEIPTFNAEEAVDITDAMKGDMCK